MNKNVFTKLIGTVYVLSVLFSCTTAPVKEDVIPQNSESNFIEDTEVQEFLPENTVIHDEDEKKTIDPVIEYEKKVASVTLSLLILPSPSIKGTSFKKPFSIKVNNSDGSEAVNFPITIEYPNNITNGVIEFATATVQTDEHGII